MRHKLFQVALLQVGLIFSPLCQANDVLAEDRQLPYVFGQGLRLGNYYLSGYTSIEFEDQFNKPAKLSLDDLSFFIGGRVGRWFNPFTEVELARHTLIKQGGNPGHGNITVERFYNDALVSDRDTLRIGKMLTPLGDWNTVFASPLVPTITRPDTTALGFETNESGINWMHDLQDGETVDTQLYWQPGNEWFKRLPRETLRNFQNVFGGHINKPFGLIDKFGLSFQHGRLVETGESYWAFGMNVMKSIGDLTLQSEAITSRFSGTALPGALQRIHSGETGIFGLADYSITPKWYGIVEWEYYQDHLVGPASRNTLFGIDFKPDPYIVWKLEYIHQQGVPTSFSPITTGMKCSFSALF